MGYDICTYYKSRRRHIGGLMAAAALLATVSLPAQAQTFVRYLCDDGTPVVAAFYKNDKTARIQVDGKGAGVATAAVGGWRALRQRRRVVLDQRAAGHFEAAEDQADDLQGAVTPVRHVRPGARGQLRVGMQRAQKIGARPRDRGLFQPLVCLETRGYSGCQGCNNVSL